MAGFKVLWASEFVDAARECYRANASRHTVVDGRDIRRVDPREILSATGLQVGELDLFDGSPPCAAFSMSGKREAGWGKVKKYSDKSQRVDDLFFEYARILRGLMPKTFIAENVSGLVKGTAKGYFIDILREMKACGYRVSCKVLDAQWLGVHQGRQRTIFVGVREDIGLDPVHPLPLPYRYTVGEAMSNLPAPSADEFYRSKSGTLTERLWSLTKPGNDFSKASRASSGKTSFFNMTMLSPRKPAPTITATCQQYHWSEYRYLTIPELKRVCGFPDDFVLTGTFKKRWERCGRSVAPVMMKHIAEAIRDRILLDRRGAA